MNDRDSKPKSVLAEPAIKLREGYEWWFSCGRWHATHEAPGVVRTAYFNEDGTVESSDDTPPHADVMAAVIAANSVGSAEITRTTLHGETIVVCTGDDDCQNDGCPRHGDDVSGSLVEDRDHECTCDEAPPEPPTLPLRAGWEWYRSDMELESEDDVWWAREISGTLTVQYIRGQNGEQNEVLADDWAPTNVVLAVIAANAPESLAAAVAGMAVPRDRAKVPEHYEVKELVEHFHDDAQDYILVSAIVGDKSLMSHDADASTAIDACNRHVDAVLTTYFPALVAERGAALDEACRMQLRAELAEAERDAQRDMTAALVAERDRLAAECAEWRDWAEDTCSIHGAIEVPLGTGAEIRSFLGADMNERRCAAHRADQVLRADLAAAVARAEMAERERDEARREAAWQNTVGGAAGDVGGSVRREALASAAASIYGPDEALRLFPVPAPTEETTP